MYATKRSNNLYWLHDMTGKVLEEPLSSETIFLTASSSKTDIITQIHRYTNHGGASAICDLVETNPALSEVLGITAADVRRAMAPPCEPCLEAKMRAKPKKGVVPENALGEALHADLVMFGLGADSPTPVLLAKEGTVGHLVMVPLETKSASSVLAGFKTVFGTLAAEKLIVLRVYTDSEAVLTSLRALLASDCNVALIQVPPGGHASPLERTVGDVRADIRVVLTQLPYPMPSSRRIDLLSHVVYIRNELPNKLSQGYSPRSQIVGELVPLRSLDQLVQWGQVGFGHDDNHPSAHAEDMPDSLPSLWGFPTVEGTEGTKSSTCSRECHASSPSSYLRRARPGSST